MQRICWHISPVKLECLELLSHVTAKNVLFLFDNRHSKTLSNAKSFVLISLGNEKNVIQTTVKNNENRNFTKWTIANPTKKSTMIKEIYEPC